MSHECFECGITCYCDLDDVLLPQPSNCTHLCEEEPDDDEDADEAADETEGVAVTP